MRYPCVALFLLTALSACGGTGDLNDGEFDPADRLLLSAGPFTEAESQKVVKDFQDNKISVLLDRVDIHGIPSESVRVPRKSEDGKLIVDYSVDLSWSTPRATNEQKLAWKSISRGLPSMTGSASVTPLIRNADGVGLPLKRPATRLVFLTTRDGWLLFIVSIILLVIYVVGLATFLRERTAGDADYDKKKPLSLSLIQTATWGFVIAVAWIYVWTATGDMAFPGSVLTILGLSISTAAIGKAMDQPPKPSALVNPDPRNRKYRKTLWGLLDGGEGDPALSRIQIVVWTVITIIIFINLVAVERALPEIDETLLALMAISSASFLIPKFRQGANN